MPVFNNPSRAIEWTTFFVMVLVAVAVAACVATVVRKSGHSAWWTLPLAGLFTWELYPQLLALIAVSSSNLQMFESSVSDWNIWEHWGGLLGLANCGLLAAFAVRTWPLEREVAYAQRRERDRLRGRFEEARTVVGPAPAGPSLGSALPVADAAARAPGNAPGGAPGAPAAEAGTPGGDAASESPDAAGGVATLTAERPSTYHCSWCGAERETGALSLHHCGSRSRPPVYCSACGTALEGAATCGECGTPSSQLSPR